MELHIRQILCKCFVLCVFLALSGCGYQFQGSGSSLPEDVKTVAIAMVENDTPEPGLGVRFTEILRSRFERYGVVKVVERPESADATLYTRIVTVATRVRDVTGDTDIELETDLIMIVSSELRRRNGQTLWRDDALEAVESFASVSDVVVTSSSSFAQGGISGEQLSTLGSREVSRGQAEVALEELMEEAARRLYLSAVAAYF